MEVLRNHIERLGGEERTRCLEAIRAILEDTSRSLSQTMQPLLKAARACRIDNYGSVARIAEEIAGLKPGDEAGRAKALELVKAAIEEGR